MGPWDVLVIVFVLLAAVGVGLYFLNRWAGKRMADQMDMVERNKMAASIYVIDKKKAKASESNLPKAVLEQIPKWSRLMKMPLVKAKIGPQIMTLMCDSKVFDVLPVKKTVKVELAGMYIVSMKGMKTKQEMAELRKARKSENADVKPAAWYSSILSRFRKSS